MRPRTSRCVGVALITAALLAPNTAGADEEKLVDAPLLWHEDDRKPFETIPAERDPSIPKDQFTQTVIRPLQRNTRFSNLVRRFGSVFGGDHVMAAANINALDEVPNSTWFTNRIGLFPVSLEDAARGPAE